MKHQHTPELHRKRPNPRWVVRVIHASSFLFASSLPLGSLFTGCASRATPFDLDAFPDAPSLGNAAIENNGLNTRNQQPQTDAGNAHEQPDAWTYESPLELTIERAVMLAVDNNRGLRVERLQPLITGTFEQLERARFDPTLDAEISYSRGRRQQISAATREIFDTFSEQQGGSVGISQEMPTGTEIDLSWSHDRTESDRVPEQHESRFGLTLTQALLRGASWDANVASIRQARLDTLASRYELRGFTEALIADVETTFWAYALAKREMEIFESSLDLAQQQLDETERRVEVGVMAETELAASKAEVAQRREDLINARSNLRQMHLRLLRLMNPNTPDAWDLELIVDGDVEIVPAVLDPIAEHVQLAMRMRPEINEAKLLLERGRLEVVRTRNGLLPRLDFFLTVGKSGFADSFGEAIRDLDGRGYDLTAGLAFSYPIGNRAADADHDRARYARRQAMESLYNLSQLVDLDVRIAHLEVERATEQIEATRATRELREETLRAETEKFRVGTSTAFLVAQAQRDLLESQIAEVRSMVNYRQTLIELYRLEGTLLLRRAIRAPGEEPITSGMTVEK